MIARFFKQLVKQVLSHDIDDAAAMLAYYTVLSAFPMLVFVVTLGVLVIPEATLADGVQMATAQFPQAIHDLVAERVHAFASASTSWYAILGILIALWGASRGAVALMKALGRLHGKGETRSWVRRQLTAIGVTFAVAALVILALALLLVGPIVGHWIADRFGLGGVFDWSWTIARWVGAGLLVMLVWAIAYRFLPNTHAPFRIFTPGAAIGVALWLAISRLFQLYVSHWSSYDKTYGTLGGAIILLTWIWLSNMALLFGAEINDVLADLRAHDSKAAAQLAAETEPSHADTRTLTQDPKGRRSNPHAHAGAAAS